MSPYILFTFGFLAANLVNAIDSWDKDYVLTKKQKKIRILIYLIPTLIIFIIYYPDWLFIG